MSTTQKTTKQHREKNVHNQKIQNLTIPISTNKKRRYQQKNFTFLASFAHVKKLVETISLHLATLKSGTKLALGHQPRDESGNVRKIETGVSLFLVYMMHEILIVQHHVF